MNLSLPWYVQVLWIPLSLAFTVAGGVGYWWTDWSRRHRVATVLLIFLAWTIGDVRQEGPSPSWFVTEIRVLQVIVAVLWLFGVALYIRQRWFSPDPGKATRASRVARLLEIGIPTILVGSVAAAAIAVTVAWNEGWNGYPAILSKGLENVNSQGFRVAGSQTESTLEGAIRHHTIHIRSRQTIHVSYDADVSRHANGQWQFLVKGRTNNTRSVSFAQMGSRYSLIAHTSPATKWSCAVNPVPDPSSIPWYLQANLKPVGPLPLEHTHKSAEPVPFSGGAFTVTPRGHNVYTVRELSVFRDSEGSETKRAGWYIKDGRILRYWTSYSLIDSGGYYESEGYRVQETFTDYGLHRRLAPYGVCFGFHPPSR